VAPRARQAVGHAVPTPLGTCQRRIRPELWSVFSEAENFTSSGATLLLAQKPGWGTWDRLWRLVRPMSK
jgi:hypothetical protein